MLTTGRGTGLGEGGVVVVGLSTTGIDGTVAGASTVGLGAVRGGRCGAWHAASNRATPNAADGDRRLT